MPGVRAIGRLGRRPRRKKLTEVGYANGEIDALAASGAVLCAD
jgi:hypothetical protein